MKSVQRVILAFVVAVTLVSLCFAQGASSKKSYTFHGKVVSVDKGAKKLTIDGEKVEGWMEAMTMGYQVDDPAVVDKVKPGDRIMATVYDGDFVLHNVKVMGQPADSKSKK